MCLLTEPRALSAEGEKRALVGNLTMPAHGLLDVSCCACKKKSSLPPVLGWASSDGLGWMGS